MIQCAYPPPSIDKVRRADAHRAHQGGDDDFVRVGHHRFECFAEFADSHRRLDTERLLRYQSRIGREFGRYKSTSLELLRERVRALDG
jgi:hypothetical protein